METIGAASRRLALQLQPLSNQAQFEARELVMFVTALSREECLVQADAPLDSAALERLNILLDRRLKGEPLAYLLGQWQFYGCDLRVNQHTLVPRPETELLVEFLLNHITMRNATCIDMGTGSGAIALAIAIARPHWSVWACDNSEEALEIARTNAKTHGVCVEQFIHSNWWQSIPAQLRFDIVVANPPYIANDDTEVETSVRAFEPPAALFAAENGLAAIRKIAEGAQSQMNENGWIGIEHGYHQGSTVRTLLENTGFIDINTHQDLAGLDRFCVARKA